MYVLAIKARGRLYELDVDSIVQTVIGVLGVALIGGVFAFARERLKAADDEIKWWREKVLPILEGQQSALDRLENTLKDFQRGTHADHR
jgi:hypothetical protein